MSEDTGTEYSFAGIKVMVIDDSKTIRRTAELILQKAGCQVITAVDGFESLALVVDHKPDIIFVDIMMPRLDGYQTCAVIKHNLVFQSIPIIMLSSKDGLFDKARGRIVGAAQYITKPFTSDELLTAIKRYVPRHADTPNAGQPSKDPPPIHAADAASTDVALTG